MKILLLLLAPLAWGQVEGIPRRFDEVYHSPGAGQKTFPTGVAAGYTVTVIDGNAAGPCTTGGGSTKSQCRYSGSVWQSVGPASAGGGDAQTASPLSQFAPTTSSQLRSVISDETGGDAAVFATSPTITTPNIAGLTGTGTADFSGATAVIMARGTTAPSSGTCDAAAEEGSIYIRTDNPATNPTQAYHCAKTGASSWAWHLISHKVGATDPAKCDEGQIFYNTTSDTLRACTAADTWAAVGGSGGGDALTANPLSQFASTSSSQLRGVLNDETGTGPAVFGTSPTIDGLVGTGAVSFGSTTGLLLRFGTTAPSSADCDSAGERGAVYVQSGNPATVATRLLICTQTGASSYAWMPSSHKVEATDPATCTEGDLFYNTTSDTLRVCTATDTWGAIGSGGGGGTAATRLESEQGTSNTAMTTPLAATYSVASAGGCGVIMSSQTVTVFPGATTAHPCNMQTGNVTRRFTAPATVVLGTGSVSVNASEALIYMKPNGTLYAGLPSAFTVGSMTLSGITAETPVTDWPAGVTRVWKWLAGTTDNFWDTTGGDGNGGSNYISLRTKSSLLAGTGVTVTENSDGEETIATDTTTIPTKDDVVTNGLRYAVTAGTSTAYTLSTPYALASPNANGVCVLGKMDETSGATPTLSVNSATARAIWKHNGTSAAAAVATGDLIANQIYEFCHNTSLNTSGVWEARNVGGGSGGSSTPSQPAFWFPGGYVSTITAAQAVSPSANDTLFNAFSPDVDMDIRSVAFYVATASGTCGGTCGLKIGIYDAAGTTILAQTAALTSGGSPDINSTGIKVATFTSTASLTKGTLYWLALSSDSTALATYNYSGSSTVGLGIDLVTALVGSVSFGYGTDGSGSGGSVALPSSKGTVTRDADKHLYVGLKY